MLSLHCEHACASSLRPSLQLKADVHKAYQAAEDGTQASQQRVRALQGQLRESVVALQEMHNVQLSSAQAELAKAAKVRTGC